MSHLFDTISKISVAHDSPYSACSARPTPLNDDIGGAPNPPKTTDADEDIPKKSLNGLNISLTKGLAALAASLRRLRARI